MKYLKMLGLAVVAAGALAAFAGAGTASATVLCKTTSTPCGEKWEPNTEIVSVLRSGTTLKISELGGSQTLLVTCTESTLKYKTKNWGSSSETVSAGLEGPTFFGGCVEKKPIVITAGEIEIHHIAGTDNGTVTAKHLEFTIQLPIIGFSCVYTAGAGIDFGTLKGGASPELEVKGAFPKKESSGAACPPEVLWTGTYGIPQPSLSIYVESE